MSKLSDFYKLQPKFGEYANEEQKKKINDIETSLIKEEILPELQKKTQPVLDDVKRPIKVVLDYTPGEEVKVAIVEDVTIPTVISEPVFTPELVFVHELNWAQFSSGMVVEFEFHQNVFKAVGFEIPRGESIQVSVILAGQEFKCHFDNANRKVSGDTIRLLYNGRQFNLGSYLQRLYADAYEYLKELKDKFGYKKYFELPDEMKVDLQIWTTEKPLTYRMECKKVID